MSRYILACANWLPNKVEWSLYGRYTGKCLELGNRGRARWEDSTEEGLRINMWSSIRYLNQAKNGSDLAKSTYLANKSFYHPIAAMLIEKDIGIAST